MRALDTKHHAMVILKIAYAADVIRERDIYLQLDRIPGVPALYGWCVTNPAVSYISIQPFAEDLYRYVMDNGPMDLMQACGIARTIVSAGSLVLSVAS